MTVSILWLGRTMPVPLNAGDRIYSAQLAAAVARQGAHVVFLGLENPDDQTGSLGQLDAGVRWKVVPGKPNSRLRSLFSHLPMVGARFATRAYRRAIARELDATDYDVVLFDQYGMSWAADFVQRIARNRPLLVHVSHDFETRVTDQIAKNFAGDFLRKFLLRENARKTRLAEAHLARICRVLVTLTDEDSAAFRRINPSLFCIVLAPGYAGSKQCSRAIDANVPRRAIIVGSFGWIAKQMNLDRFLKAAGDTFVQHRVELHVVGVVPEPLLFSLQSRFPWVVFRGFVDDLSAEFQNARIALVPEEIGGGFKLKILDYIFSRVPVAAVEAALNGVPRQLKTQFIVGSDIGELILAIVTVIDDIGRLDRMQNRAVQLAENLFDWDTNGRRLLEALDHTVADALIETPLKSARR